MKIKLTVKKVSGKKPWSETYIRQIGEERTVRGYGSQPVFAGDAEAWGKALVDWFNAGLPANETRNRREFVSAEVLS